MNWALIKKNLQPSLGDRQRMQYWPNCVWNRHLKANKREHGSHRVIFCKTYVCNTSHCFVQQHFGQSHYQAVQDNAQTKGVWTREKYIQSNQLFKLKKRHRLFGMCYIGRQCSTYPVSICLGTPSIVSPWPWLTLNFCPEEPLHNITHSKAIELLDAIWNPCVV